MIIGLSDFEIVFSGFFYPSYPLIKEREYLIIKGVSLMDQ